MIPAALEAIASHDYPRLKHILTSYGTPDKYRLAHSILDFRQVPLDYQGFRKWLIENKVLGDIMGYSRCGDTHRISGQGLPPRPHDHMGQRHQNPSWANTFRTWRRCQACKVCINRRAYSSRCFFPTRTLNDCKNQSHRH